jgi:hypothetical protein
MRVSAYNPYFFRSETFRLIQNGLWYCLLACIVKISRQDEFVFRPLIQSKATAQNRRQCCDTLRMVFHSASAASG